MLMCFAICCRALHLSWAIFYASGDNLYISLVALHCDFCTKQLLKCCTCCIWLFPPICIQKVNTQKLKLLWRYGEQFCHHVIKINVNTLNASEEGNHPHVKDGRKEIAAAVVFLCFFIFDQQSVLLCNKWLPRQWGEKHFKALHQVIV